MKKLLFVLFIMSSLLVISLPVKSQEVVLTPKVGSSVLYGLRGFVGAELQASCVSVTAKWCPTMINKKLSNGFFLSGTFYLNKYTSSPFFTTGILTQGKQNIDKVNGKPVRSMPIFVGYRYYPADYHNRITNNLSFDFGIGAEICRNMSVRPYAEFSVNFTLFKY